VKFRTLGKQALLALLLAAPLGVASAADLPVKAKPVVPPFSWTGFYIGGFVGMGQELDQTLTSDPCNPAFGLGCIIGTTGNYNAVTPVQYDMAPSFVGGGRIGYNWQPNPFLLLGIEDEAGYLHLKGTANMNPFGLVPGDTNAFTKVGDWYDVLAGRIGIVNGRVVFYGRAGVAWANESTGVIDTNPLGATINTTRSKTVTGWAAGGGLEAALDLHWSVRADYLFLGIEDSRFVSCGTAFRGGTVAIAGQFCSGTSTAGVQMFTVGLDYHFR
jgi:outer membrane immunogenic protein